MTHALKIWPFEFEAVRTGRKVHEVRIDDRGFKVDDLLLLREWDPEKMKFTGQVVLRIVTHKTPGGAWGLPANTCVLSIPR